MGKQRHEGLESVPHPPEAPGQVHDEAAADEAGPPPRERGEGRLAEASGADLLRQARGLPLEDLERRLGGDVPGPEARTPRGHDEPRDDYGRPEGLHDGRGLVGDDPGAVDVEPGRGQSSAGLGAGEILALSAAAGVAHRDHRGAGRLWSQRQLQGLTFAESETYSGW